MADIKNIQLAFPCDQTRGNMSIKDQHLHCEQCKHRVHDFTNSSSEELENTIKKAGKPVCGIFKTTQLSKDLVKYASLSLITTASIFSASCAQENELPEPEFFEIIEIEEPPEEIFGMMIETMPKPIGGISKFHEAIAKSITLPKHLKDIPSRVFVSFVVSPEGKMTQIEITKGGSEELNQVILKAFEALDYRFKPGEQRGVKVATRTMIPVLLEVR